MKVQVFIVVNTELLDEVDRISKMKTLSREADRVLAKFVGKKGVTGTSAKTLPAYHDQDIWFEISGGMPESVVEAYAQAMRLIRRYFNVAHMPFRIECAEISREIPTEPISYVEDFFADLKIKTTVTVMAA